jgi:glycosyltransferase involved in cell wall biosynthesis
MRILYFTSSWTTHDHRFLRTMVAAGHDAWLLREDNTGHPLPAGQLPAGAREVQWQNASLSNLCDAIDRVRPDLLHAGPVGTCGHLAALSGFHPFVLMSWGSDVLWDADREPGLRERARVALAAADWLICDCREVGLRAAEIADYPEERSVTFPWGIDEESASPPAIRQRAGWERAPIVLSTRSWEPVYGIDVAIDAFTLASRAEPSAKLVLAGDGSRRAAVGTQILSRGIVSRTHLAGRISQLELPAYYHAADVYLSCSYSDGSSVSLIEALAAGLPVVVTDIPGNREWIEHEKNGWLCPAGDISAFADALGAAIKLTPGERSRMAERNRALARSRADWRIHSAVLQQTYQKALERYGHRG